MDFKDHFSKQATDYAKYRPGYPDKLFRYLSSLVAEHDCAWDCGTGNGQAAFGLAPYFKRIIATDPSEKQIDNAIRHDKIIYRIAPAEQPGIAANSVDLVTVAQALHWFDLERFYQQVKKVLTPEGVLAVWSYNTLKIEPEIDAIIDHYYTDIVGSYWPPERKFVEEEYRTIPFPFEELNTPQFKIVANWSFDDLIGYLRTWSATRRYLDAGNRDPIPAISKKIKEAWDMPSAAKRVEWPLTLKAGQMSVI